MANPDLTPPTAPRYVDLKEALSALYGVLRIARFDPSGINWINPSPDAAKRSFIVLIPLLFAWLIQTWLTRIAMAGQDMIPATQAYSLIVVNKIIAVFFFYLVVDNLLRTIGGREHFARYVTTQNWASLPIIALVLPLNALWIFAHVDADTVKWITVLVQAGLIIYSWLLTMASLRLSSLTAFFLCILEVLAGMMVDIVMRLILTATTS